jgi:hypothetical protein
MKRDDPIFDKLRDPNEQLIDGRTGRSSPESPTTFLVFHIEIVPKDVDAWRSVCCGLSSGLYFACLSIDGLAVYDGAVGEDIPFYVSYGHDRAWRLGCISFKAWLYVQQTNFFETRRSISVIMEALQ